MSKKYELTSLPNPHYDPELRHLTGKDAQVAQFLEGEHEVC